MRTSVSNWSIVVHKPTVSVTGHLAFFYRGVGTFIRSLIVDDSVNRSKVQTPKIAALQS